MPGLLHRDSLLNLLTTLWAPEKKGSWFLSFRRQKVSCSGATQNSRWRGEKKNEFFPSGRELVRVSQVALVVKSPPANAEDARDSGSIPELGRFPGGGNGKSLIFLPGKFHGQRSLADYSPWGHKESDTTDELSARARAHTCAHTHTHAHTHTDGIYILSF